MYTLTGDCARLCIPEARPPAQVDGLWRHTCFEAFFSVEGESAYLELNFSPSGEWAAYHFRGYRELSLLAEEEPRPQITTWRTEQSFVLDARMQLPQPLTIQPLRLGLSAVVEDDRGQLSYWALKHPPGKPDFHHAEAFALRIEPRQSRKGQQP
jgi:hypothetical protein